MTAPLWFDNLAAYSIQIAVLVVIGAGLAAVLRLRAPRVCLAYWQTLLVACLTLPLVQPWKQTVIVLASDVGKVDIEFGALVPKPGHAAFPIFTLVAIALGLGIAFRLIRVALGLLRLRQYSRRAQAWEPVPAAVNELRARLGVAPAFLLSPEIAGPVTYGSIRPVVLFPARFAQMDAECQRGVVCHELVHVSRGHWFFNLAEEIILAIFWFHPAFAWVVRRIRLAREQTVDREVLHLTAARRPYLRALLEIAAAPEWPLTVPAPEFMKENQLTQRVALIMKEVSMSKSRLVLSMTLALASIFLTAQAAVRAFPLKERPVEVPAPAVRVEPVVAGDQSAENPEPVVKPAEQKTSKVEKVEDVPHLQPIQKVNPIYPPLAKMAKIEGVVELQITVEKTGEVSDIKAISGHPLLVKAAMNAVQNWKYSPQPQRTESTVTVNFTLAKEPVDEDALAEAKAQVERALAERQIHQTEQQFSALAQAIAEQKELSAQMSAGEESHLMQAQEKQIAMMKAEKAQLEIRIAQAEQELKAAQKVSGGTASPKPVKTEPPVYPPEAKAAHIQGVVVLRVTLNEDGGVSDIEAESGPPVLVKAAIDAVRQWQFSNPSQTEVTTTVTVNFSLADGESNPSPAPKSSPANKPSPATKPSPK
jgi:bla regulator protein blaR1